AARSAAAIVRAGVAVGCVELRTGVAAAVRTGRSVGAVGRARGAVGGPAGQSCAWSLVSTFRRIAGDVDDRAAGHVRIGVRAVEPGERVDLVGVGVDLVRGGIVLTDRPDGAVDVGA